MKQYIDKSAVVAEIESLRRTTFTNFDEGVNCAVQTLLEIIDTLEVKEVDLIINTIIAECCDWLTICTDLSHGLIEDCRNLMLAVKEEQFKA